MSHIFISYSHKDNEYAHALAEHLQSMDFPVWIDDRIDYGSQWPGEIQKQLDACAAFILIMSPRSFASEWVQSELQRAKRKARPVFPLLLEGEETWLSVESTQYYDVRNRNLPDHEFYADLKQAVSGAGTAPTHSQPPASALKAEPIKYIPLGKRKNVGWFAAGGIAAICICLLTGVLLFQRVADRGLSASIPTGTDIAIAGSTTPSPAAPPSTAISPVPPATTAVVLPVQLPDGSEVIMREVAARSEFHYTILSAQRESLSPDKYLLRLRIRAWSPTGSMPIWSESFRLVVGDLRIAPVNNINLMARQDETVDVDVEFEIDASLKDAILKITWANSPADWATKELRLVFP
jgi:hypothetical protein